MAQSTVLPEAGTSGLLDLEKELTCSICTDILYQPLTVLDCLHTFCGSCLKEWFGFQAVRAQQENQRNHSRPPRNVDYTCPSCRAVVRDARPDARVATLLDMFMQANPSKGKTEAEKLEMRKTYKPGDIVMPQARAQVRPSHDDDELVDSDDEDDRRLMEQVRELSLREASGGSQASHPRQRRHLYAPGGTSHHRRSRTPTDTSNRDYSARRSLGLEHQASLRTLLRHSNVDSMEIQEDIMRQIAEEGLLDGIDLDDIRPEQEDEISERIASAYRRRLRQRARHGSTRNPPDTDGSTNRPNNTSSAEQSRERATPRQSTSRRSSETRSGRPSLEHPSARQGPTSNPPSSYTAPNNDGVQRAHSDYELTNTPRQVLREHRRSTDPQGPRPSEAWGLAGGSGRPSISSTVRNQPIQFPDPEAVSHQSPVELATAEPLAAELSAEPQEQPQEEVSVSCDRCGRHHIEYEVHHTCLSCAVNQNGTFDVCHRCYLSGKGCQHWFGFGDSAWRRWETLLTSGNIPQDSDFPHSLETRKYIKSPSSEHPILQQGVFCNMCGQHANGCYWHCETCNEGEWGYCNSCINQARHCTHPLISLELISKGDFTAHFATQTATEYYIAVANNTYLIPISTSASCDICHQRISSLEPRLHCRSCNNGDYDICTACYTKLQTDGTIGELDGDRGWRKCPQGHRMVVVGFREQTGGDDAVTNWRHVLHDVVAGWALLSKQFQQHVGKPKELHNVIEALNKGQAVAPPPRTYGAVRVARWTRLPDEAGKDELMFPKGAELREVAEINSDWGWGVYCRDGGLFPLAYVKSPD